MSHEKSETVKRNGKWINVYGRNLPKAGKKLPGSGTFETVDEAVKAAGARSRAFPSGAEKQGAFQLKKGGKVFNSKKTSGKRVIQAEKAKLKKKPVVKKSKLSKRDKSALEIKIMSVVNALPRTKKR